MKTKTKILLLITFLVVTLLSTQSCYHYRVLTTGDDPATEYRDTTMWSFCWGLVNKPSANFRVPNCGETGGLDEVRMTTNFGGALITVLTLGLASPVHVQWKCHKPCDREEEIIQ